MKKYIFIILVIFQSCYTVKKAQKQVIKADLTYPEMFTNYVVKAYPIKDSIIEKIKIVKGKDIIKFDTIKEIDCDSIVSDTIIDNKVLIRYKTIFRTDTVQTTKEVFKENTSRVKNLNLVVKRLTEEKNQLQKYKNYFIGIIVIISIFIILKFL